MRIPCPSSLTALVLLTLLPGCSSEDDQGGGGSSTPPKIQVSGHAFAFTLPGEDYGRIAGATISVLEMPEQSVTTDSEGAFLFPELPSGQEATFVMTADGFPTGQTKTFTLPESPLERVTFQIPNDALYTTLEGVIGIQSDPARCQMVSTLTVVGKSLYDPGAHGVEGATVSTDPVADAEVGPIYFNSNVIPDKSRSESSDDGGVLWGNVAPGEYTVSASKSGTAFESIRLKCRPGILVNASPPYGLQQLAN